METTNRILNVLLSEENSTSKDSGIKQSPILENVKNDEHK